MEEREKQLPWWSLCASIIAFVVFYASTCPSCGHGHDTGEMITAGCTLGIPHPPGYPLYVRLSHIWVELLNIGRPDWRMNLFSGFCVSVGCAFLCDGLKRVTNNPYIAISGTLLFALCRSVWRQSVIAEVFGLHWFYLCLYFWLAVVWANCSDRHRFWVVNAMGFCLGNCLAHHHTILFATPGLLLYAFMQKGENRPWGFSYPALLLVFLGWIPFYLDMMWRSQAHPFLDWGSPHNEGLMRNHFLRKAYGTFSLSLSDNDAGTGVAHAAAYFISLCRIQFPMPISLLGIVGLQGLRSNRLRPVTALLATWWLVQGPLFAMYARQPSQVFFIDMQERFYAASYLGAAGLITIGAHLILVHLSRWKKVAFTVLFCALPLFLVQHNWKTCNESDLWVGYQTCKAQFDACSKRGMLIVDGDLACGISEYLKAVEHYRPDLSIIFPGVAGGDWGRTNLEPELRQALEPILATTGDNDQALELCARVHRARGFRVFGGTKLNIPGIWLPRGVVWEWFPDEKSLPNAKEEFEIQAQALKQIQQTEHLGRHRRLAGNGFWVNYSLSVWTNGLHSIAEVTFQQRPELAIQALEEIRKYDELKTLQLINLGHLYKATGNSTKAEEAFKEALKGEPGNTLAKAGLCDLYYSLGRTKEADAIRETIQRH